MDNLIINPITRHALENYVKKPAHALLLAGASGVGLGTVAKALAHEVAGTNIKLIQPTLHKQQKTANINIDDIREIVELSRAKRSQRFVIVVDEAEKLTLSAPEAFLKVLEEPNQNLHFILTTHELQRLPATIRSRAQTIQVLPSADEACARLCDGRKLTDTKRTQIQFIAPGRPAEIARLLDGEEYFRGATAIVETAKNFVQGTPATRLKIIAGITTRDAALSLANNIAKLLILTTPRARNQKTAATNLNMISEVIDNLTQNGNINAQLLYLALNI